MAAVEVCASELFLWGNMLKKIEWGFVVLLALGALGHTAGTFMTLDIGSGIFVWSLSGVLACGLVIALNVLSIQRPEDSALRYLAGAGALGWIVIVVLFGLSIGNVADPRVLMHLIAAAGLLVLAVRRVA